MASMKGVPASSPAFASLPAEVQELFSGCINPADVGNDVYSSLSEFAQDDMMTIARRFASSDFSEVRNKTAFLVGIIDKKRRGKLQLHTKLMDPFFHTFESLPTPVKQKLGRLFGSGEVSRHELDGKLWATLNQFSESAMLKMIATFSWNLKRSKGKINNKQGYFIGIISQFRREKGTGSRDQSSGHSSRREKQRRDSEASSANSTITNAGSTSGAETATSSTSGSSQHSTPHDSPLVPVPHSHLLSPPASLKLGHPIPTMVLSNLQYSTSTQPLVGATLSSRNDLISSENSLAQSHQSSSELLAAGDPLASSGRGNRPRRNSAKEVGGEINVPASGGNVGSSSIGIFRPFQFVDMNLVPRAAAPCQLSSDAPPFMQTGRSSKREENLEGGDTRENTPPDPGVIQMLLSENRRAREWMMAAEKDRAQLQMRLSQMQASLDYAIRLNHKLRSEMDAKIETVVSRVGSGQGGHLSQPFRQIGSNFQRLDEAKQYTSLSLEGPGGVWS